MALVPFALLVMLGLAILGPAAADVKDLAGPARRRIAIGICFLCVNVLCCGIAPPIIGKLGDLLDAATHPERMGPSLLVCLSQPSSRRPCCTSRAARSRSRNTSDSGPQGRSTIDSRDSLRCAARARRATAMFHDIGASTSGTSPTFFMYAGRSSACSGPFCACTPTTATGCRGTTRSPRAWLLRGTSGCETRSYTSRHQSTPSARLTKKSRSTTSRCCAGTPAVPTARAPSRTAEAQP